MMPKVVGIVNITTDSFSDGGKFVSSDAAIEQAKKLIAEGADIVELSGASSNPRSEPVAAEVEITRIEPVLAALGNIPVSIDAFKPQVQRWAMSKNVAYLNDIKGFPDESLYPELAVGRWKLVVMHMISTEDRAGRPDKTTQEVFDSIYSFFDSRIPVLERAGIARERIIIDPGMGMFLSSRVEASYAVLDAIADLKARFQLPVMISVSRKSFLRGGFSPMSAETAARTLELELKAASRGVDYIRTHDVGALQPALAKSLHSKG